MHAPLAVNDIEVYTLWWIAVAVGFVVVIVAVGLLHNILAVASNIDANVGEIWTVGKRIANNTVELWLLGRVNALVEEIRGLALRINEVAGSIAAHATQCRHCPACVGPRSGDRGLGGMPGGPASSEGK